MTTLYLRIHLNNKGGIRCKETSPKGFTIPYSLPFPQRLESKQLDKVENTLLDDLNKLCENPSLSDH